MPRKLPVKQAQSRRLSAADAAFLYLERKEIPLHIASVAIFDGPIPFDEFLTSIESKLHLIPRYRQIVVSAPFNLSHPTWEHDPHFDIRRHVFRATVDPPGGDVQLEALAGRILSQLMDRGKPLWDIHVVEGLQEGRGALIVRVHHSLADGISGAALMKVMLDPTPEESRVIPQRRSRTPRRKPSEFSLADTVTDTVRNTVEGLMAAEAGLLGLAESISGNGLPSALPGLLSLLPELAASIERLPFNKPCGGNRKFCWAEFRIADVQAIREAAGGTVNDVILTVLTLALARYVKRHRQTVVNRFVRIVCPVNLRHGEQDGNLGNQISFMPVELPMDVPNPVDMLRAVAMRTEIMKRSRAADLVGLAAACIAAAPPPLQALFWQGLSQITLPVPLLNMICTNIPGSPVPLYAAGRRMIAAYPQVPTGYELGIGCAVQSYDGKLFFGLIADADVAPDVHRLRDFIQVSFQELCRAAGVKKAPRRAMSRTRPAQPAEPVQAAPLDTGIEAPDKNLPAPIASAATNSARTLPERSV